MVCLLIDFVLDGLRDGWQHESIRGAKELDKALTAKAVALLLRDEATVTIRYLHEERL